MGQLYLSQQSESRDWVFQNYTIYNYYYYYYYYNYMNLIGIERNGVNGTARRRGKAQEVEEQCS